jgi:WYL_2, Sm-like SH3 beta-barrel fold
MTKRDELKALLKENIVNISFTKKDGSERKLKCTLKTDLLPKIELDPNKPRKAENVDVLPVWDLENKGFRSFRLESLISYEIES